ncbi:DoxX family protein [Propionibacterium freudenreichii]|nr:DoxX family protein [Propionibacterium freudenreichii]
MPNMPVVAASTVFGADLSHNSSARDMADTATQKPVIDTAAADRERKAREEAARVKQEEAAQRARERAARERRLGTVAQQPQEPLVIEKPQGPSTDKFAPALGLFLMRLVTAVIIGVYGYQMLTERQPVVDALVSIGIPRAGMVTWGLSVLLLVMAVMFVFGFGARVAGALTTVLAGLTIAFYRWGDFNPFVAGTAGFSGDIELLLAGIGLVFLLVGAGGWSLDGGIRRSRVRRKQEAEF